MKFSIFAICTTPLLGSVAATPIAGTPTAPEWSLITPGAIVGSLSQRDLYGSNFAGAAILSNPSGKYPVTAVSALFVVPTPKAIPGSTSGVTNAWVGIDGTTCRSALFNAGVAMSVSNNKPSFYAYAQWSPGPQVVFKNFPIFAGDTITIVVHATTPGNGHVNVTAASGSAQQRATSATLSAPNPSATLCGTGAEWIVESPGKGSNPSINNWGTVSFVYTGAEDLNGNTYRPDSGTELLEIKQNNVIYSSVSAGSFNVDVKYIGPGA